jgi:hypothetical protein
MFFLWVPSLPLLIKTKQNKTEKRYFQLAQYNCSFEGYSAKPPLTGNATNGTHSVCCTSSSYYQFVPIFFTFKQFCELNYKNGYRYTTQTSRTMNTYSKSGKQNWPRIKLKRNGNTTYINICRRSPTIKPMQYAFGCPVPA